MKIRKKDLLAIKNEIKEFEINIKSIKNENELLLLQKKYILNTFNTFSKLNEFNEYFKELIVIPVKLAIITLYIIKKRDYENFEKTDLIYPVFNDICLYTKNCPKINNMELYKIGFKHFKDYNDFEENLYKKIFDFLNFINKQNATNIEISIYYLTKYIYLLFIYHKFNLKDKIKEKYQEFSKIKNNDENNKNNEDNMYNLDIDIDIDIDTDIK